MEEQRSGGIGKWLLIAVAAYLFVQYGYPAITGKTGGSAPELQPLGGIDDHVAPPGQRPAEEICSLRGPRFTADVTSRGAALRHVMLTDSRYSIDGKPIDLLRGDLRDYRLPLRTDLRPGTIRDPALKPSENLVASSDTTQQVPYDELDFKLGPHDDTSCTFKYEDANAAVTKVVSTTKKPYELAVTLTVENRSAEPKKHRLAVEEADWRTDKEMAGAGMGSLMDRFRGASATEATVEWQRTEAIAATTAKTERDGPSAFEPSDFKKKEFDDEKWRQTPGTAKFAGVASNFFARVVAPIDGPKPPRAERLVEDVWNTAKQKRSSDPDAGHVFRSRLAYPPVELASNQSATYKFVSYTGPNERASLAAVGDDISGVMNLGYFSLIGKYLLLYLYKLKELTQSWGLAIVLLTISVRLLVFPLSIAQIKSTAQMRKLKPELDELNKRYKDDMTQRGLATQELYRKHGMSQFGQMAGCLPMILQLPIWWALYSALQTAVELYHTPFLWFVDLSSPDKYFIIPVILGATSFLQQKLMPAQADPQQQKMMMYMMPGIFTVMMLFLPSGLGVYMFTSSLVSIGQQFVVERYLRSRGETGIVVTERLSGGDKGSPGLGKGKARVRG